MGRKKRKQLTLKPFCFYCDRDFEDEKVLIQHQKARHFKCAECNRKLDTATGLVVHMLQVHKQTLTKVPNALAGRESAEVIIHGSDGVPPDVVAERQAKLTEMRGNVKQARSAHTVVGMGLLPQFQANPQIFASMLAMMKLLRPPAAPGAAPGGPAQLPKGVPGFAGEPSQPSGFSSSPRPPPV
eukprot:Polyplicarium_translucidae@DN1852_c0_g1_i1.p3